MVFAKKSDFRRPKDYERHFYGQNPISPVIDLQQFFMHHAVEKPELSFENTQDYLCECTKHRAKNKH